MHQFGGTERSWPGVTKVRNLASLTAAKNGMRLKLLAATISQPEVCAMVSISSTPGISGKPGKWPSKMVLAVGIVASAADRTIGEIEVDDPVDQLEVLKPHVRP